MVRKSSEFVANPIDVVVVVVIVVVYNQLQVVMRNPLFHQMVHHLKSLQSIEVKMSAMSTYALFIVCLFIEQW